MADDNKVQINIVTNADTQGVEETRQALVASLFPSNSNVTVTNRKQPMKHAIAILILSASLAIADDKTFSSSGDFRSIPGDDVMQHAADVDSNGHAVIRTKPGAGTTQAISGAVSATLSGTSAVRVTAPVALSGTSAVEVTAPVTVNPGWSPSLSATNVSVFSAETNALAVSACDSAFVQNLETNTASGSVMVIIGNGSTEVGPGHSITFHGLTNQNQLSLSATTEGYTNRVFVYSWTPAK